MSSGVSVDQVLLLARQLSPAEKVRLINELSPDSANLDDQYERGYRQIPEDITDVEALLPHLPLPAELSATKLNEVAKAARFALEI